MQAELDIDYLDNYMQLAEFVAQKCKELNIDKNVGAVIVDLVRQEVVAVAGDARLWTLGLEQKCREYWGIIHPCGRLPWWQRKSLSAEDLARALSPTD